MWDERYSNEEYAYGKEPNDFLKAKYHKIPKGNVLCLAEGEGRYGVYLAKTGYNVTAVDSSKVGLQKAEKLAAENGVTLNLIHADLAEYDLGTSKWDGIVSIYVPFHATLRVELHKKVVAGLKTGGVYLVEAYTPNQLNYNTGGGKSIETMVTREALVRELNGLSFLHLLELEREVFEGKYHTGLSAVVQLIGAKLD